MNKRMNSERFQAMVCGLLVAGAAALSSAARADEPAPPCLKCSQAERAIPLLSKIPYVSRLFKNIGPQQEIERIGVDFDFDVCEVCPQACQTGVAVGTCQPSARPQLFVFRHTPQGAAAAPCYDNEPCCGEDCEASACCESACCQAVSKTAAHGGPSWERFVELAASNAALEAVLEARTSFEEEKSDLLETLAEALVEKAKLEAKVESQAQQAELTKELLTLMSENARLKVQVEIAEAKLPLAHEMAKLTFENEQLKLALQTRHSRGQLADDVQYFPPSPEARPGPAAPAKKASFQEVEPSLGSPVAKPVR